jgi:DNA-binding transcriptional ArsR family regulator
MTSRPDRSEAVFSALADPTRRRVLARLSEGATTASGLARELPVSRQAIAKHLAALAEAGLVTGERAGREHRYRLTPAPLTDAVGWMAALGAEWDERLSRLRRLVEGGRVPRSTKR